MADRSPDSAGEASLLAYRSEFPTLATKTHLISHSLGAMPRRTRDHAARFLDEWEKDSIEAWHLHWLPEVDALGDLIATVLGVPPGSVVLSQNVSTLESMVASCFE